MDSTNDSGIMMENKVCIVLSLEDWNIVLAALGEVPARISLKVILDIQQQANEIQSKTDSEKP